MAIPLDDAGSFCGATTIENPSLATKLNRVRRQGLTKPSGQPNPRPAKLPDLGFKEQELQSIALKTEQTGEVA
jgi:hypothetical protein